ncbi:hypothetical protein XELAEV_18015517mg [Xenopus laevis]|uniref:Uncharacterized protein n=1 Tax=Xenopus laevis TaxID=8355 RepID=A0A974HW15_XENLA|nr:hypothetical protein XELAEV_18015517mg [Xenopus laevis]
MRGINGETKKMARGVECRKNTGRKRKWGRVIVENQKVQQKLKGVEEVKCGRRGEEDKKKVDRWLYSQIPELETGSICICENN